jgi:hypothetical protein
MVLEYKCGSIAFFGTGGLGLPMAPLVMIFRTGIKIIPAVLGDGDN